MAKMTKKGREFVSDEISHLMKDGPSKGPQKGKKMPQKQAVAVALDVSRRKGFKTPKNPKEESFDFSLSTRKITHKEEKMSIFDSIISERELPESFKKNMGRFKLGGKKDDDDADDKPFFTKKDDDDDDDDDDDGDAECGESVSVFDAIVQESAPTKSMFDDIVQESTKSAFDDIIEGSKSTTWDDQVARTMALAEQLVDIRSSVKNG